MALFSLKQRIEGTVIKNVFVPGELLFVIGRWRCGGFISNGQGFGVGLALGLIDEFPKLV